MIAEHPMIYHGSSADSPPEARHREETGDDHRKD